MEAEIRFVTAHVVVFEWEGHFLLSADTEREALEELAAA